MPTSHALNQYRQVKVQTAVPTADPHRLVAMLFEGALEKIQGAKLRIDHHGSIAEKGELISGAISITDALRASLDKTQGGEIAENLDQLYEYMGRRLLEANLHNDTKALDEVAFLLRSIEEAWSAIAPQETGPVEPTARVSVGA